MSGSVRRGSAAPHATTSFTSVLGLLYVITFAYEYFLLPFAPQGTWQHGSHEHYS